MCYSSQLKQLCCVFYSSVLFFSYACHEPQLVSQETASLFAECSLDKPPFSFVRGQDSTGWGIVWVSPQGHRSVSVSRHFLLQAPQCPCSVGKRFTSDHCCPVACRIQQSFPDPGCQMGVAHYVSVDHLSRIPVKPPSTFDVNLLQVQPQRLPGCQS